MDLPGAGTHAKAPKIERLVRVTGHYIRCTENRAIPLATQDFMIAAVDGALGGRARVHSLTAGLSPFYSQPMLLADLLAIPST